MSMGNQKSGAGWTADLVGRALDAGAKLEAFNGTYVKIHLKRPHADPASKSGWNRFAAEGAPEYNSASLVPVEVANEATKTRYARVAAPDLRYLADKAGKHDVPVSIPVSYAYNGGVLVHGCVFAGYEVEPPILPEGCELVDMAVGLNLNVAPPKATKVLRRSAQPLPTPAQSQSAPPRMKA